MRFTKGISNEKKIALFDSMVESIAQELSDEYNESASWENNTTNVEERIKQFYHRLGFLSATDFSLDTLMYSLSTHNVLINYEREKKQTLFDYLTKNREKMDESIYREIMAILFPFDGE